ncbi:MAG: hypothetical protein SGJ19_06230 [Planctomycetia bacterium]|nr:hypothetical protein [Planctomycetia bacterium]
MICVIRAVVMWPKRASSDWSATTPSQISFSQRIARAISPGDARDPAAWRHFCGAVAELLLAATPTAHVKFTGDGNALTDMLGVDEHNRLMEELGL